MHGAAFDPLSTGHHDLAADERLARWPIGSSILFMTAAGTFLWTAIYFGVRAII